MKVPRKNPTQERLVNSRQTAVTVAVEGGIKVRVPTVVVSIGARSNRAGTKTARVGRSNAVVAQSTTVAVVIVAVVSSSAAVSVTITAWGVVGWPNQSTTVTSAVVGVIVVVGTVRSRAIAVARAVSIPVVVSVVTVSVVVSIVVVVAASVTVTTIIATSVAIIVVTIVVVGASNGRLNKRGSIAAIAAIATVSSAIVAIVVPSVTATVVAIAVYANLGGRFFGRKDGLGGLGGCEGTGPEDEQGGKEERELHGSFELRGGATNNRVCEDTTVQLLCEIKIARIFCDLRQRKSEAEPSPGLHFARL